MELFLDMWSSLFIHIIIHNTISTISEMFQSKRYSTTHTFVSRMQVHDHTMDIAIMLVSYNKECIIIAMHIGRYRLTSANINASMHPTV